MVGEVIFSCNDDQLACLLLTGCKSDSSGFFNLLAGCKPLQVEQWLTYLEENSFAEADEAKTVEHKADEPVRTTAAKKTSKS